MAHPAALLKATPLSTQHLLESMLSLACVLTLASCHLLSWVPSSGIQYPLMSAIPSPRLSFGLNSKLTSSALPMDSNDYLASIALLNFISKALSNYNYIVLYKSTSVCNRKIQFNHKIQINYYKTKHLNKHGKACKNNRN